MCRFLPVPPAFGPVLTKITRILATKASKPASFRANFNAFGGLRHSSDFVSGIRCALIQRDRVGLRLRRSVTPLPTVPFRPSAALFVGRRTIADSTPALCYTYSIPIEHILCLSDLAESPIPDAKTRRREGQHGGCRIERTSAEQKVYFLDIRSKRPLTIELKACRGGQSIAEDSCCPPKGKFRRAAPKSSFVSLVFDSCDQHSDP